MNPSFPLRILCVDDEAIIREVLVKVYERAGHACVAAAGVDEALQHLRPGQPVFDVVHTDHRMPARTGLALVEELRAAAFAGKVVVYSSPLDASTRAAYAARRVDVFLEKPAPFAQLLEAVTSQPPR